MQKPNLDYSTPVYVWYDGYRAGWADAMRLRDDAELWMAKYYRLVHVSRLESGAEGCTLDAS